MSAIFALLFIFATHRIVPEPTSAREAQFDESWEDVMQVFPLAKKTDPLRTIATESKPVVTERIVPDAPAKVPPVLALPEEDKPVVKRRRHARDVCRGKGKRYTHGGRSWRCRR